VTSPSTGGAAVVALPADAAVADVARYYDASTRRFLRLGSGGGVHAMHRELWASGVASTAAAADHVNRLVADEIAALGIADPVVVDFGCGVGGTLFHLARRFPGARLRGVTVSERQVEIAERLAARAGLSDRCSFSRGDFQRVELGLAADTVLAVESFVHSTSADAFLASAARHLRDRGLLILVDDFLAGAADSMSARRRARVEELRAGWLAFALCTGESLIGRAAAMGFLLEKRVDLTGLTRPGSRMRDRLTALVAPLLSGLGLARIPLYGNMIGGNALQVGLREGFLAYEMLTLRKSSAEYRNAARERTIRAV
jgi:SAM-dependent methyltransferase